MREGKLAVLGALPRFERILPVGQLYFPSWSRYIEAMQGIFDRQYYTNQGPLTDELERSIQDLLDVKHAICVTNATIGLMMAADALGLRNKVIVPGFTFAATAQSLSWCGLEPVFCDVDLATHHVTPETLSHCDLEDVSAVLAVNLWGGACDISALSDWCGARELKLYFDSAHAFGCKAGGKFIGGFGELEVFSFHATKILSAAEGGCITTNDDLLAARLRNIRSSYGAGSPVEVVKTSNGRMSEAQAALALMSLEDFADNCRTNAQLHHRYRLLLEEVPGITMLAPTGVSLSNHQYVTCLLDEAIFGLDRDTLLGALNAENIYGRRYFYPGLHRTTPYVSAASSLPNTEKLCSIGFQLPIGAALNESTVADICEVIADIHKAAPEIRVRHAG